jgi:hypothetical protein
MELRKIYGKWDTGIGKYWHKIETTGGKSLKRPRFTTDCRATKEEDTHGRLCPPPQVLLAKVMPASVYVS